MYNNYNRQINAAFDKHKDVNNIYNGGIGMENVNYDSDNPYSGNTVASTSPTSANMNQNAMYNHNYNNDGQNSDHGLAHSAPQQGQATIGASIGMSMGTNKSGTNGFGTDSESSSDPLDSEDNPNENDNGVDSDHVTILSMNSDRNSIRQSHNTLAFLTMANDNSNYSYNNNENRDKSHQNQQIEMQTNVTNKNNEPKSDLLQPNTQMTTPKLPPLSFEDNHSQV